MFPRVVSVLLVPTLFLQGMAEGHSLGPTSLHEPAGHEQRPHFHLSMVGLYHHAPKYHHAGQDGKPNGRQEQTLAQQAPTQDHDDDAVSLSARLMLGGRSLHSQVASGDCSALVPMDATTGSPVTTAHSPLLAHPPPSFLCHQFPLYLRTLALPICPSRH